MFAIPRGVGRRKFLQSGVGLAALMWPPLQQPQVARAAAAGRRAKSVIFLLLEGGMSHLDTWDPKPDGPQEIRGEFATIETANPDLRIGEHMPLLAKQAHRYNVVRSVHSSARNHSPGLHWVLTGYDNPAASVNRETSNNYPSVGSVVAHERGAVTPDGLPNHIAIPNRRQLGGRVQYTDALHLGAECDPFDAGQIPGKASASYTVPAGLVLPPTIPSNRLADRQSLLERFRQLQERCEMAEFRSGLTDYQRQAYALLLGGKGRAAFDINQEPQSTRTRYGESQIGQGTLLARRLVESGVTFVLVNYSKNNSWDTHRDNFQRLKKTLLPSMDQAVSALLTDLDERGMLDDTLVLMMGEMGRTPTINKNAGRDHWPDVYSALIAGGGLTRGQVLGSSDSQGRKPDNRAVHVNEVLATLYHQLGIDPHLVLPDLQNRPIAVLPGGSPVRELIA